MSPDLRIRGVGDQTHARLVARATANGRSIEGELRVLLSDALDDGSGIGPADWKNAGFDQVDEVVPGRIYDAWALQEHYRIYISRAVLTGSTIRWNSEIDKEVLVGDEHVWTSPSGIPARLNGNTAEEALADAMRWLGEWDGFDKMGRERRDAEAAERMEPGLRQVADSVNELLGTKVKSSWRDERRARWSTDELDFYIARSDDEIVLMTYNAGAAKHAFAPKRFLFVTDVARRIVETIYLHMAGEGDPVSRMGAKRVDEATSATPKSRGRRRLY